MGYLTVNKNHIGVEKRNEVVKMFAWGKDILRFQSSPNGVCEDEDWILLPQPEVPVQTESREHSAVITNGRLRAELFDNGKVIYYKKNRSTGEFEILLEEMTEYAFDAFYRTYRAKG